MDFHLIKKNNIWRLEQNQISSILTFQQVITDFRNHFNFSSQQSQIKQNFTHKQFSSSKQQNIIHIQQKFIHTQVPSTSTTNSFNCRVFFLHHRRSTRILELNASFSRQWDSSTVLSNDNERAKIRSGKFCLRKFSSNETNETPSFSAATC